MFRLHAFLALTFGALVVALLTPTSNVRDNSIRTQRLNVAAVDGDEFTLVLPKDYKVPTDTICYVYDELPSDDEEPIGSLLVTGSKKVTLEDGRVQRQVVAQRRLISNGIATDDPFIITTSGLATANSLAGQTVGKRLANGFGNTCGCLLYTSPSPRDATLSRMPSSA